MPPWYDGPTLLRAARELPDRAGAHRRRVADAGAVRGARRRGVGHQARTLWGRIAHGRVQRRRHGAAAARRPERRACSRGAARRRVGRRRRQAGESAGVVLDRQLDVSRGDWIAAPGTLRETQRFEATLAWLDTEPRRSVGRKYWVRHGNRWVQARISAIEHRLDIHTLQPTDAHELAVNDIGRGHRRDCSSRCRSSPTRTTASAAR